MVDRQYPLRHKGFSYQDGLGTNVEKPEKSLFPAKNGILTN